jgi:subtilisin family serine protease
LLKMIDDIVKKISKLHEENQSKGKLKPDAFSGVTSITPYSGNPESLAQEAGWQIEAFDFPDIWSETKGSGIKVAIIDGGVDVSHPDLEIERSLDFLNISSTSWWDSENERVVVPDIDYGTYTPTDDHGTHVTGIVSARDNGIGMVGVAPECTIYALRAMNEAGTGSYADIAIALLWCLYNEDIDVVNMSIGGFFGNEPLWDVMKLLYDANIPMVVSAGNEYFDANYRGYISFPAQYDEAISVAAIDTNGSRASFSSVGPALDVAAPGVGILSTVIGGGYASFNGTSMAAPFVTGLCALILAKQRQLNNPSVKTIEDLRRQLTNFATDEDAFTGRDIYTGWGIVEPNKSFGATREVEALPSVPFGRLYAGSIINYNDRPWQRRR